MNLDMMRTMVRQNLRDTIPAHYRWKDDTLNRHISRAAADYSAASPRQMKSVLMTAFGSMDLDISSIDRIIVLAVEYPVDERQRKFRCFSVWADRLTLIDGEAPDGSSIAVYYGCSHTLDEKSSSLPPQHHGLVALGAAAYAAVEWSAYGANQLNSGSTAASDYMRWGKEKANIFRDELRSLSRRNSYKHGRLFKPTEPSCPADTGFWGRIAGE